MLLCAPVIVSCELNWIELNCRVLGGGVRTGLDLGAPVAQRHAGALAAPGVSYSRTRAHLPLRAVLAGAVGARRERRDGAGERRAAAGARGRRHGGLQGQRARHAARPQRVHRVRHGPLPAPGALSLLAAPLPKLPSHFTGTTRILLTCTSSVHWPAFSTLTYWAKSSMCTDYRVTLLILNMLLFNLNK